MAVSELPGNPNAVWTVKKNVDGNFIQILFILLLLYSRYYIADSFIVAGRAIYLENLIFCCKLITRTSFDFSAGYI